MKTPLLESIATDYRRSCILFGAMELGLFEHLMAADQPAPIDTLSDAFGVKAPRLCALINCLVQFGVLQTDGAAVSLDAELKASIGDEEIGALENYRDEVSEWLKLASMLKAKPESSREDTVFSTDSIFTYLDMVKASNRERITKTAPIICDYANGFTSLIDVGGGHGAFSAEVLRLKPEAQATVYDLPVAIDYAKQSMPTDLLGRVTLVPGDARKMEIVGEYDAVLINDVLHSYGADEKINILRRAVNAITPGGSIFVGKFFMDEEDPKNPSNNHTFSMKMILNTRDGYLESIQEVQRDLAELNCTDIKVYELEHHMPSVIVAAKRSAA
ncbi:methyltransferase [Xanthomonas fragariae]|uniref:methyltransferase n=1 Tax=Xanthomonas fragariae TaxID=48664 RepID=UPI001ABE0CB4|nr:methyltransferase [Xanthomonas fragariae]UKR51866.1 methyltransferase domain-containing protein [Xanthomonas fragariae]WAT13952.1 methyltransferase [Xanthomonas fragariae]